LSATLTLEKAARFLALSRDALRRDLNTGVILAKMVAKCWWSYRPGSVDYLRSVDAGALFATRR
jgi:hypothetical protein